MGNSINNQFKMRRHGGQADRAKETSPGAYSVNQERTMANMGMAPTNYGTPLNEPGDKKPGDEFNYSSDMGKYNPTITSYKGDAFVGTRGGKPQAPCSKVQGFTEGGSSSGKYFRGTTVGPASGTKSKQSRKVRGGFYES